MPDVVDLVHLQCQLVLRSSLRKHPFTLDVRLLFKPLRPLPHEVRMGVRTPNNYNYSHFHKYNTWIRNSFNVQTNRLKKTEHNADYEGYKFFHLLP